MKKKILLCQALPHFLVRCFSFSDHYSKNGQYVKVKLSLLFSFVWFSLLAQHSPFASNGSIVIPAGTIVSKNADDIERHRVWLNMANTQGAFKQLLVGYIEGATNAHDNMFDGETQDANPYLDFYSMIGDRKYVIQGRALPFSDADLVPLGYRSALVSDFTISIDQADGNLINQDIYIQDKVTGATHNLKTGGYTFSTVIGTFDDRFILRYTNNTLGTGTFENIEKEVFISVKNKIITINANDNLIDEIYVYDITGKEIYKSNLNDVAFQIENLESQNQILLVRVILENNNITTQKIVF
ncbi:T9SS sorting signal type C domain-containing protein [Flavobacterium sp. 1355]|jgi:hypothetical protein|uniref:T9SS sorting signal type C domain-containing protein n=1 Tax=Flavobacterium sp. 1355 TaxID=2806571 RepID=UPI001AE1445E|nr:T9SS sorting signal type C domain-containing protein [Flavobacterium sp. 1355]MBP1223234.1 hypothetical protein [Flavobacterium sp. 1355]